MKNEVSVKQLLIVFLIIALFGLTYIYVYAPLNKEIEASNIKKDDLNRQLTEMQNQGNAMTINEQKNAIVKSQIEFLSSLPKELKEEKVILTIMQIIKKVPGVKVQTVSLMKPEIITANAATDVTMKIQLSGICKYGEMKQLLSVIKDCKPKVKAENLSMSAGQNSQNPNINFTMQLTFLGYNGPNDKEYINLSPKLAEMDAYKYESKGLKSKANLFDPVAGGGGISSLTTILGNVSNNSSNKNDFFVSILPATFDRPGVTVGISGDGTKSINNAVDGLSKVEFVFESKNGQVFYKYKVGGKNYPANYAAPEKFVLADGSGIYLSIIGKKIMEAKDKVSAEVSIINNTNLPVYVDVEGVTQNSPKLKIVKTKGLITDTWK